jgi:hypothetical protein
MDCYVPPTADRVERLHDCTAMVRRRERGPRRGGVLGACGEVFAILQCYFFSRPWRGGGGGLPRGSCLGGWCGTQIQRPFRHLNPPDKKCAHNNNQSCRQWIFFLTLPRNSMPLTTHGYVCFNNRPAISVRVIRHLVSKAETELTPSSLRS